MASSLPRGVVLRAPSADGAIGPAWGPFDDYRCTHQMFRRALGSILEPYGLAVSDYSALRLAKSAPTRPGVLSLNLGISPATTTELIDRLEQHGLVRRERDPTDRRATVVSLTRAGERIYREASGAHQRFLYELAREMDPVALRALQDGAKELRRVLERRADGAAKGAREA